MTELDSLLHTEEKFHFPSVFNNELMRNQRSLISASFLSLIYFRYYTSCVVCLKFFCSQSVNGKHVN